MTLRNSFRGVAVALLFKAFALTSVIAATDAQPPAGSPDETLNRMVKILKFGGFNPASGEPTKVDAAHALGLLGDTRAVPTMAEHLENESDNQLKVELARALGWIGSPDAIPALEKALADKYPYVRKQSAISLKKITGKDYTYDQTGLPTPASIEEIRKRMEERRAATSASPAK